MCQIYYDDSMETNMGPRYHNKVNHISIVNLWWNDSMETDMGSGYHNKVNHISIVNLWWNDSMDTNMGSRYHNTKSETSPKVGEVLNFRTVWCKSIEIRRAG